MTKKTPSYRATEIYYDPDSRVVGVAAGAESFDVLDKRQLDWHYFHLGEFLFALQVTPDDCEAALMEYCNDPENVAARASIEECYYANPDMTVEYVAENVYPNVPKKAMN